MPGPCQNAPQNAPRLVTLALALFVMACAAAPRPVTAPASAPASTAAPGALHWARSAAEHRAIYLGTFRAAGDRLVALSNSPTARAWGVILDADETVLDNSEYEAERVPFGGSYNAAEWNAWVARAQAPALPGAVAFIDRVHQLGGKVVIVTNRDESSCHITRTNFERVSIHADLVLCKTGTDDKNPRFDAVQLGTAAAGFPAITVMEWIGDNIQDFPHLSQGIRDDPDTAFAEFGRRFFALPNAMYGSWQRNPPR
ncbi:MAG: hypothetical protein M3R65_02720 [Gemmatimonadota bacterium]|nr:hypothetical protein [Gemmatimonadota bacterium]